MKGMCLILRWRSGTICFYTVSLLQRIEVYELFILFFHIYFEHTND